MSVITNPGSGGGGGGGTCANSPQLFCLGGRAGGQTANGGTVSGDNLILHSNTSLDGYTEFDGQLRLKANVLGNGGIIGGTASGSLQILTLDISTATSLTGPGAIRTIFVDFEALQAGMTVTDGDYIPLLLGNGNINLAATTDKAAVFGVVATGTVTLTDSTMESLIGLFSSTTIAQADGTTQTLHLGNPFEAGIGYAAVNTGALTVTASHMFWDNMFTNTGGATDSISIVQHTAVFSEPSLGDFTTITDRFGIEFKDFQDSRSGPNRGTITNQTCVLVEDLRADGGVALSLRSKGAAVEMRHLGPAVFGADAAPTGAYVLEVIGDAHISGKLTLDGALDPTHITMPEQGSTPPDPASNAAFRIYQRGKKFVIQFNDGGTVRYATYDLTQSATALWATSTTPP